MADLLLPDRRLESPLEPKKQPTGPVRIDWSNPLTHGLRFFAIPDSSLMRDVVSGQLGVVTSGSFTTGTDDTGKFIQSVGNSKLVFDDVFHGIGTGDLTFTTRFSWDGSTGSFQTPISLPNNSALGMYIPRSNSQLFFASDTTAGGLSSWTGTSVTQDEFNVWSLRRKGGSSQQSEAYKDGVFQTRTGGAAVTLSSGDKGVQLYTGQGGEFGHGRMSFAAVWKRQLLDSEQRAFNDDPYQVLVPA